MTPIATKAFAGDDVFHIVGASIARDAALIKAGLDLDLAEAARLALPIRAS